MHSVYRKMIAVAPVLPVCVALLLWLVSYSHTFQVAIHGPGAGYVSVESGLGRMCLGRCFDEIDRWRGIRHSILRAADQEDGIWSYGLAFDTSYAEAEGYQELRVWFPYWALCLVCAAWPAHCIYLELRSRLAPVPRTTWACC